MSTVIPSISVTWWPDSGLLVSTADAVTALGQSMALGLQLGALAVLALIFVGRRFQ